MIEYRMNLYEGVGVKLDSDGIDKPASIEVYGPEPSRTYVESELSSCSGLYGHRIGDAATPSDLQAAMERKGGKMAIYGPELIQGADVLSQQLSDIPEGSVP